MQPEATFSQISAQYMKNVNKHIWMIKENSLRGMTFPPLNAEGGETNTKSGNVTEVARVWGASLNFKAHC